MKVVWAGTFEPEFSRNRKLARLLQLAGIQTVVVREQVWGDNRIELASRGRVRVALRALLRYPRLLLRLLSGPRPDLYFVSYPGWFDVPIVRLVASIKGRPVVFDPFISLHDTMISDRRLHSQRSMSARLAGTVDRWSLRMADLVIADTAPQLGLYHEMAHWLRADGVVVPVGADDHVFLPGHDVGVDLNTVLFYGTLVPLQGVATIVEAAALLESDDVRMVVIGDGQDRPVMEAAIERTGASVVQLGMIPLEELPGYVARATVCLGIFGDSDKAGRVVPHKLYECLAMGRPVITRDGPAIQSLFKEGEVITVPPADPLALADAIRSLIHDPERREQVARSGHAAYTQRFHEEALAQLLSVALHTAVRLRPQIP
jgi:glycosyltransferase involved in cell wall biosynthesis